MVLTTHKYRIQNQIRYKHPFKTATQTTLTNPNLDQDIKFDPFLDGIKWPETNTVNIRPEMRNNVKCLKNVLRFFYFYLLFYQLGCWLGLSFLSWSSPLLRRAVSASFIPSALIFRSTLFRLIGRVFARYYFPIDIFIT